MTTESNEEALNGRHGPRISEIEQGPIRPPSESESLLLRLTRNCPWNKCLFCHTYRDTSFSIRPLADIMAEIHLIDEISRVIRHLSHDIGLNGQIDENLVRFIAAQEGTSTTMVTVAVWLYYGGQSIFFQDANSLVMPVDDLVHIVETVRERFPHVTRITSYARSQTLARMKPGSLERLAAAGLGRIHVGMESGHDRTLKRMRKGSTAAQHIEGGRAVRTAGIELSEYIILGLAGRESWREHALESAAVLNAINPDFIRFRTLALPTGAPLHSQWQEGTFVRMTDDDIVREERLLLETLQVTSSQVVSDHITNLLETVAGTLPEDRDRMLAVLDSYLALDEHDRQLFQIGRRYGWCREIRHLSQTDLRKRAERLRDQFIRDGFASVDEALWFMTQRFI